MISLSDEERRTFILVPAPWYEHVYLLECTFDTQRPLDRLSSAVAQFSMLFVPSKCKMLLHDWTTAVPKVILVGEELTIVVRFSYLCSCLTADGSTAVQVTRAYPKLDGIRQTEALAVSGRYFTELKRSQVPWCSALRSSTWSRDMKFTCRRCSSSGDFRLPIAT